MFKMITKTLGFAIIPTLTIWLVTSLTTFDKQKKYLRYSHNGKIYKIYISYDERIFLPIARDSKKFKEIYKGRTTIERINGRLDRDYMFENHQIRGLKKMNLMVSIAMIVMNGMAVGKVKSNISTIRSLKTA